MNYFINGGLILVALFFLYILAGALIISGGNREEFRNRIDGILGLENNILFYTLTNFVIPIFVIGGIIGFIYQIILRKMEDEEWH